MNIYKTGFVMLCLLLASCEEAALQAVGQLESDRIELVAEYAEPILAIAVTEGDGLQPGALVLRQDGSRIESQIAAADANRQRLLAVLQEQLNGERPEQIAIVETSLAEAIIEHDYRSKELARAESLRQQNLGSQESVDNARRLLDAAVARIDNVEAQLTLLHAGTREERVVQTRNQLQQVEAEIAGLRLNLERLEITAPVAGLVDSLPFEVGERPRPGDVVAVLLGGTQPYARVYIPEIMRTSLRPGSTLQVHVDGVTEALTGTVRRIAAEPSFTPYFALTERDRGRLSYVAEVTLPERAERLPDGVPVQISFE
jgi:HlyD family secretion protein